MSSSKTPSQVASASGEHDHEEVFDPAAHRPSKRGLWWSAFFGALVIALLLAAGIIPRLRERATSSEDAERAKSERPHVLVVRPEHALSHGAIELPSSVEPERETIIYARTSGYVRRFFVDIGDPVRQNQKLAELETPEVDQELRQAQAAANQAQALIEQAKTQLELARTTVNRYDALAPSGYTSHQEIDEKHASLNVQVANVAGAEAAYKSALANVHRLEELKSFALVLAPFDGVVTARSVENGQLVTAGSAAGQSMFKVAKVDLVRLFIHVPQLFAPSVRAGQAAEVTVRELPNRTFSGSISRTAGALDASTRTLLTEVRISNKDGALLSGMYAQVRLEAAGAHADQLLLPATALVVNAKGTRVAVVDGEELHWKTVVVDSDLGDRVAIASGLSETDRVLVTPSGSFADGMKLSVEEKKSQEPAKANLPSAPSKG